LTPTRRADDERRLAMSWVWEMLRALGGRVYDLREAGFREQRQSGLRLRDMPVPASVGGLADGRKAVRSVLETAPLRRSAWLEPHLVDRGLDIGSHRWEVYIPPSDLDSRGD
jgi:hypothetical protein